MEIKFKPCTQNAMRVIVVGISLIISGCAAVNGANCRTTCKEGPKDYNVQSRWVCQYDDGSSSGNLSIYNTPDESASVCTLKIEGRLKPVDSARGGFKTESDCFENFCVPKLVEICGMEDRCASPKNWYERPSLRKQFRY